MAALFLLLYNMMGIVVAPPVIPDFLVKGSCAKVSMQHNFNIDKYLGLWWEIFAVPIPSIYLPTTSCIMQNYTQKGLSSMNVNTTGLNDSGQKVNKIALLSPNQRSRSSAKTGDFMVESFGVPPAPYQVIATDYQTYSCVYSCMDFMEYKAEFVWVLGRAPHIVTKSMEKCTNAFDEYGIDPTLLRKTTQGKVKLHEHDQASVIHTFATSNHFRMNFPLTSRIDVSKTKSIISTSKYPLIIPSHLKNIDSAGYCLVTSAYFYMSYLLSIPLILPLLSFFMDGEFNHSQITTFTSSIINKIDNDLTSVQNSYITATAASTLSSVISSEILALPNPYNSTILTAQNMPINETAAPTLSPVISSEILALPSPYNSTILTAQNIPINETTTMFPSTYFRATYTSTEPIDSSTVSLIQTSTFITTSYMTTYVQTVENLQVLVTYTSSTGLIQFLGNMTIISDASILTELTGSFDFSNSELTINTAIPIPINTFNTLVFNNTGTQNIETSQILSMSNKPVTITQNSTDSSITTFISTTTNSIQRASIIPDLPGSFTFSYSEIPFPTDSSITTITSITAITDIIPNVECKCDDNKPLLVTAPSNTTINILEIVGAVTLLAATIASIYLSTVLVVDLVSKMIVSFSGYSISTSQAGGAMKNFVIALNQTKSVHKLV